MPKIQRLDANGNLFVQGIFDEISGTRIREFANGDLFAKEFDEIATELDSSNIIRRIMADGSILIKGFFDEVTKLEAAGGGGGGGDTNLQFNVTAGTIFAGALSLDHEFTNTGGVSSPTSAGNGTWYNGTATGSNFEIQIVVNSITTTTISIEGDSFTSPGTSSWYTLNISRFVTVFNDGTANVTVKIREIATPSNMISQTFNYELSS